MAVIKVPRTPKKAYDPERRISDLLRRQVEHLEWAVRPASRRKHSKVPKVRAKTEGEAAEKIEKLTAAILEQARKDAEIAAAPGGFAALAPQVTPPSPPRRRTPKGRRKTRTAKRKPARSASARSRRRS